MIGKKYSKLTVIQNLGLRHTSKKKRSTFVLCECECGNFCEVRLTYLNTGRTKSCGCLQKEAVSKSNKKILIGKRFGYLVVLSESGKTKLGSIVWKCKCDCDVVCEIDGHSLRRGSTKSCGCLIHEKRKRGKEHHSYKHELSDSDRIDRRSLYEVIEWRKKIYEKDNYCCQKCGDTSGGNLNAHHLNGWNMFPDERFNIENGITLCEKCHDEFHKKLGFGDNTKEQFTNFLLG